MCAFQKFLLDCNEQIDETVALVRCKLESGSRITLGALIVLDVHGQYNQHKPIHHFISTESSAILCRSNLLSTESLTKMLYKRYENKM